MPEALLRCADPACRRETTELPSNYCCPRCGGLLEVHYRLAAVRARGWPELWRQRQGGKDPLDQSGVWRFRELLPTPATPESVVSMGEGSTPLVEAPGTGSWAGVGRLWIKHQGMNPTGSFKDLGMTVCLTEAAQRRTQMVACASTGNTSASMSAYAVRAGLIPLVFVPQGVVSGAKLAQAIDFGALVVATGKDFDQTFRILRELGSRLSLFLVNSINPFRLEGQKTVVLEILEQRGWQTPDFIVLPGGNLGNVSAAGKCLSELTTLELMPRLPRLVVVQAEGADPFHRMWQAGAAELTPVTEPSTRATAIRIGNPANWPKAKRALEATSGLTEAVSDEEIWEAKQRLAQDGIGCEPASAASVAGIRKLADSGAMGPDSEVVAILTGHQLKDTDYIRERPQREIEGPVLSVEADLDLIQAALRKRLGTWVG